MYSKFGKLQNMCDKLSGNDCKKDCKFKSMFQDTLSSKPFIKMTF